MVIGYENIMEDHIRRELRIVPHLKIRRRDCDTGIVHVRQEEGQAHIGPTKDDYEVRDRRIGNPALSAVEKPSSRNGSSHCLYRIQREVGTCSRFASGK